jgi:hypothetical protein
MRAATLGVLRFGFALFAFLGVLTFAAKADDMLSPRLQRAVMQAELLPCSLQLPAGVAWSDVERIIFLNLCSGSDRVADLSRFDGTALPCNPHQIEGDVPEHRSISARFLQMVVGKSDFHRRMNRLFLSIRCAKIIGTLDLSYMNIPFGLRIEESHFMYPVKFYETNALYTLSLSGSTFERDFDGDGMQVSGSL